MKPRLGLIARADNSGLGTMSVEWARHFPETKVLVMKPGTYAAFPDRFPNARITHKVSDADMEWLLDDIDVLVAFETPYDWRALQLAAKRGVRTVLVPMYECMPQRWPCLPDLILCPSRLDFDIFKAEFGKKTRVEHLPWPVNRKKVPFRLRGTARVFEHHAGHGGMAGRNGTAELLAAIPMIKSDAKVVIYSQRSLSFEHPKLTLKVGNFQDYWDIWGGGDVFIFPHKFDGLSLPIQEALSSGLPVLTTAIYPFTGWLPDDWLIDPVERLQARLADRMVDIALTEPAAIAAKIDQWYGRSLAEDSRAANRLAEAISWKILLSRYRQLLTELVR